MIAWLKTKLCRHEWVKTSVHRIIHEAFNHQVHETLWVCHKCDDHSWRGSWEG